MEISELSIQCWNINGIFTNINSFKYSKLDNPLFINIVQQYEIFGLIETHHTSEDIEKLQIMGYKCFQACRKKLKFGRKHGGIAVYVRDSLLPGVTKVPTTRSETVQIKLDSSVRFYLKFPTGKLFGKISFLQKNFAGGGHIGLWNIGV